MAQIVGPDGKPLQSSETRRPKPEMRELAVASVRDRWSTYPSNGLTPERLSRILREADAGDLSRWAELAEEMEEKDTHLQSIMQTRKLGVLGTEWDVLPFEADNGTDAQVADFVTWALDQVKDWEGSLLDVLDAFGKGLSISELYWEMRDGRAVVNRIKHVHLKRFRFDEADEMRLTSDTDPAGILLRENKFVVHRHKARSGHAARAGLLRTCSWMYLFKNFSMKDWLAFAEIYGMPIRIGKYDQQATEADKRALLDALINLASDAAGIIPKNADVEFVTDSLRTAGGDVFKALAMFCNSEMSKAVLGQTLTTEVGEVGSYGASKTHDGVRQDLREADCKAVAETIRQQLITPLVLFNFGTGAVSRLPWVKFHCEPPADLKSEADTYKVLVVDIGLPVSQEHLYEKFGVPKPEDDQALVVPPTAAAPAVPLPLSADPDLLRLVLTNRRAAASRQPVEELAAVARDKAQRIMVGLEQQVQELIRSSASLEEVRDRLAELYKDQDLREFQNLVSRVTMAADLWGRSTVSRDG